MKTGKGGGWALCSERQSEKELIQKALEWRIANNSSYPAAAEKFGLTLNKIRYFRREKKVKQKKIIVTGQKERTEKIYRPLYESHLAGEPVRSIAKRTGYSDQLLYYHFDNMRGGKVKRDKHVVRQAPEQIETDKEEFSLSKRCLRLSWSAMCKTECHTNTQP